MSFLYRESYVPPEKVKLRIKAFLKARGMSQEDFGRAIDVTEEELEAFMSGRKKRPQQESKVFHDAMDGEDVHIWGINVRFKHGWMHSMLGGLSLDVLFT
ncbi:hypothetical protein F4818DRAFT_446736 [Hypoxylon cercidicola]|nr:hypothetical protein F4818DRAFT_446736 [Hypoxylon cercidicola]